MIAVEAWSEVAIGLLFLLPVAYWISAMEHADDGWEYPWQYPDERRKHASKIDPGMR